MPICRRCQQSFPISAADRTFYNRMNVPEPGLCPGCREQRRAAFRNLRSLYRDSCDLSAASIISLYSPDKPFKVYETQAWWSDHWDAHSYGRPYDPSRSFFEQFYELMKAVPRPALLNKDSENSTYTNHCPGNKDCYMCFNTGFCRNVLYSSGLTVNCSDSAELTFVFESELVYECVDCNNCYNSQGLLNCQHCSDCAFLFDCRNCQYCILCSNLRNKSYHIANQPVTKEQYQEFARANALTDRRVWQELLRAFVEMLATQAIHPALIRSECTDSSGNYLRNVERLHACVDATESQDVSYSRSFFGCHNCYDNLESNGSHWSLEVQACSFGQELRFSNVCRDSAFLTYCDYCMNSRDLFGCAGLNHKQYCVLNKQYSAEEYKALSAQIERDMRNRGEFGEFFPAKFSPFDYNETVANELYPLSPEQAKEQGLSWGEHEGRQSANSQDLQDAASLPNDLNQVDWTSKQVLCSVSRRPFRITEAELTLYRKLRVPLPNVHPDERHKRRSALRYNDKISCVACHACQQHTDTFVPPQRAANVLCEKCYLQRLY